MDNASLIVAAADADRFNILTLTTACVDAGTVYTVVFVVAARADCPKIPDAIF